MTTLTETPWNQYPSGWGYQGPVDISGGTLTIDGTATTVANTVWTDVSASTVALGDFSGNQDVNVSASGSASTPFSFTGPAGVATTVQFSGASSQYTIAAADGGIAVTKGGVTDHFSNVLQVAFSNLTMTVAPTNSASEYLALLYQGSLGRTPDAAGLQGWITRANAVSAAITELGAYGLSDASGNFNGSMSIAAGFTNSAEFQAKYGSLSNADFINQLYANILDRSADTAGFNSWMTALNAGQSREHVLIGLAELAEAISNATHGFTGQSGTHAAWLLLT